MTNSWQARSSAVRWAAWTFGCAAAMAAGVPGWAATAGTPGDWQQFGYDARHSGVNPLETTLQQSNVATLHVRYKAALPGVVDDTVVFLSDVTTASGIHDVLFATTEAGQLLALDADSGALLWSRQPASGPRYTTSAPAIDPNRQFVYSYSLEGKVHKYKVGDGTEVTTGGWPELATLKPQVEKCSPALAVAGAANGHTYLYVANGGYPGDQGDYQGHVTAIDLASGAQNLWNADCSNQAVHFTTGSPDCPQVQSAVWARGGVVYDSDFDRIFFATGNGQFDASQGGRDWGDTVVELRPDGTGGSGGLPTDSYTPVDFAELDDQDLDLGSTAPALLPVVAGSRFPHLGVQSGKDGMLRLINLDNLSGKGAPGNVGGELQLIPVPQGGQVLTAPAVWTDPSTGSVWLFLANNYGIAGLQLVVGAGGMPSLALQWMNGAGGTSPVVANGIVYYVGTAGLQALTPRHGAVLWQDPSPGSIHWQSPIVVNGRVYVADGDGNLWAYEPTVRATCTADATTLCLAGSRFQVRASWQTSAGTSGAGQAVALTADTGTFWFFAASNVEVIAKVLNGCGLNSQYWFFAGGLTNVSVALTVTDTTDGQSRTYLNPQGAPFQPIQDTSAFATCP
jgi:PQQ-like domain